MPLQATSGAASYDAFGGGVAVVPNYIEDVFSTYLFTGNGSTQTVTNGINLTGKGGMVWRKQRDAVVDHFIADTVRGTYSTLSSNTTAAASGSSYIDFLADGFQAINSGGSNPSGGTQASWTFREQPKFFDVVTYTGTGANRTIAHSLGSVPGCIMVKRTDTTGDWQVYHQSLANTEYMVLNSTAAKATGATRWNSTTPTSTVFSLGTDATVNASGGTYVAYVYASNAGGFGLTGTDNVISCGSFTAPTSGNTTSVNLGYEPQWILVKDVTSGSAYWVTVDNMRGASVTSNAYLYPNTSGAEDVYGTSYITPTATGFTMKSDFYTGGDSVIYIAIRRGPMKVPTDGTKVFGLNARTGTGANVTVTGSAGVSDAVLVKNRGAAVGDLFASRLTGTGYLETSSTAAEVAAGTTILQANPWDVMDGVKVGTTSTITNASANTYINYLFDRAPGFFDEVCWTYDSANVYGPRNHNLSVAPELYIEKRRNPAGLGWYVAMYPANTYGQLDTTSQFYPLGNTLPTATQFTPVTQSGVGSTYVAYLFASAPGVSKVGSYTGTGTTQQINCGFTAGARFVLIKRTDSTGDWYVWDSARGIVAGNDSYLLLNSTAAEVTSTDYIDTYSAGFEISSTAPAAINASGGTFLFFAVA